MSPDPFSFWCFCPDLTLNLTSLITILPLIISHCSLWHVLIFLELTFPLFSFKLSIFSFASLIITTFAMFFCHQSTMKYTQINAKYNSKTLVSLKMFAKVNLYDRNFLQNTCQRIWRQNNYLFHKHLLCTQNAIAMWLNMTNCTGCIHATECVALVIFSFILSHRPLYSV